METALQRRYEQIENLNDIREHFANGLLADLKQSGEAEYYVNNKKQILTFSEVVEHFDCDLDDILKAFFISPNNEDFTSNRLRNAMYEKAQDLTMLIAERVYP